MCTCDHDIMWCDTEGTFYTYGLMLITEDGKVKKACEEIQRYGFKAEVEADGRAIIVGLN